MTDRDIYEEVRGSLMRFATSLVGRDEAADLVSEVVVAAMQKRPLSSLQNPRAYLMQAVLNRAKTRGRRLYQERNAVARLSGLARRSDEFECSDADVIRTVASLPAQQRAAVYLVYWEDLAPSEAAELLGIRPGTLRRYLHLARGKLRRHLDE